MDPATLLAFASWAARACCDEPEKVLWLRGVLRAFWGYSDLGPMPDDLRRRFDEIKKEVL